MRDWNKHQCLMFFLCFFFLSAGLSQRVYAVQSIAMGIDQQLQITGVVKDTNGEPMIGVTVMVKGTGTGTITDIDGKYSVSVPGNKSVLTFSFVGYTTKEVTVGNQKSINVTLSEDSKNVDEVVVTGFPTTEKRESDSFCSFRWSRSHWKTGRLPISDKPCKAWFRA